VSKLLPALLSTVVGLTVAAVPAPPASAHPARLTTGTGLGVITAVSSTATTVTTNFVFTGTEATGFVLAVPRDATLSTLTPARLAREFSLSTIAGVKVHYILLGAKADYLSVALHSPQPDLRLTFARTLFRFSASASRQIASHAVRSVRMGIAFSGGPGQLLAAKFAFAV
jgi:hypothetical protein